MPVRSGFRPAGSRLAPGPTDIKLKGLQIQRPGTHQSLKSAFIDWDDLWPSWFRPQIDLAADNEMANCVKWASSSQAVINGDITQARSNEITRQWVEYAGDKGLNVYSCSNFFVDGDAPGNDPATLDHIVSTAEILAEYPHVVAMDMSNEVQGSGWSPLIWGEVRAAIKSVARSLPLSLSVAFPSTSDNGGLADTRIYADYWPYVDIGDFHPYISGPGGAFDPAGGNAVPDDFAVYRADPHYKPWIIGECGGPLVFGEEAQTARWRALAVLSSEPDCLGCVGYTTQDVILSGGDHGIYSNDDPPVRRAWMADVFKNEWPGRR